MTIPTNTKKGYITAYNQSWILMTFSPHLNHLRVGLLRNVLGDSILNFEKQIVDIRIRGKTSLVAYEFNYLMSNLKFLSINQKF